MKCPVCKRGDIVIRINRRTGNRFYGCSNYPYCGYTENSAELNMYDSEKEAVYCQPSKAGTAADTEIKKDNNYTKYRYCHVKFFGSSALYWYIDDTGAANVGDIALVPVFNEGEKMTSIVEVCDFYEHNAPYPVNRTKHIIRIKKPDKS